MDGWAEIPPQFLFGAHMAPWCESIRKHQNSQAPWCCTNVRRHLKALLPGSGKPNSARKRHSANRHRTPVDISNLFCQETANPTLPGNGTVQTGIELQQSQLHRCSEQPLTTQLRYQCMRALHSHILCTLATRATSGVVRMSQTVQLANQKLSRATQKPTSNTCQTH